MELLPLSPPGSAKRKLRAYLVEIGRLRNEGYTIAVILEALKAKGVSASWSTVQREAKKLEVVAAAAPSVNSKRVVPPSPVAHAPPAKLGQSIDVESFFQPASANPLFRKKKL